MASTELDEQYKTTTFDFYSFTKYVFNFCKYARQILGESLSCVCVYNVWHLIRLWYAFYIFQKT